jgi:hypothetical protein
LASVDEEEAHAYASATFASTSASGAGRSIAFPSVASTGYETGSFAAASAFAAILAAACSDTAPIDVAATGQGGGKEAGTSGDAGYDGDISTSIETRTGFTSSYGYQFAPGTGKGASGSK